MRDDQLNAEAVARLARARTAWVVGLPLVFMLAFLAIGTFRPARYRVEVTFLPSPDPQASGGADADGGVLAALLPGGGEGADSPAYYVEVLRSDRVLHGVARATYTLPNGNGVGSLADVVGVAVSDSGMRESAAVRWLRRRLAIHAGYRSGLVHIAVDGPTPEMAAQLATRFLEVTDQFNRQVRRSRARAEREFLEERRAAVAIERRAAEDNLAGFLAAYHESRTDPELGFQENRLRSVVEQLRMLETGIAVSLEEARTSEVRTTPVLTVVQPPVAPVRSAPRRLPLLALLGLASGALIGWPMAVWRESVRTAAGAARADWRELSAAGAMTSRTDTEHEDA